MEATTNTFRQYYFCIQAMMLKEPNRAFNDILQKQGLKRPLCALLTSSIIYALTSILVSRSETPFFHFTVLLVNALGMVFIAAAIGYSILVVFSGRLIPFTKLLPIYALSSGITLLVAWIPYSLWFTELWKWWLIGTGLTKVCALKGGPVIATIIGSIGIITLLFSWVLPYVTFHGG